MQQRQPRLGDVVDDYCPRERRVTNHAVVAMVGDEVKQTRCTTCDAEHDYKHARVPPQRKKKDVPGRCISRSSTGFPGSCRRRSRRRRRRRDGAACRPTPRPSRGRCRAAGGRRRAVGRARGPVHRRLIRATLPRLPGAEPPRAARARVHDARPGSWAARQAEERLSRRRHAPRAVDRPGRDKGRAGQRQPWRQAARSSRRRRVPGIAPASPAQGGRGPGGQRPGSRRQEAFAVARPRARPSRIIRCD